MEAVKAVGTAVDVGTMEVGDTVDTAAVAHSID